MVWFEIVIREFSILIIDDNRIVLVFGGFVEGEFLEYDYRKVDICRNFFFLLIYLYNVILCVMDCNDDVILCVMECNFYVILCEMECNDGYYVDDIEEEKMVIEFDDVNIL